MPADITALFDRHSQGVHPDASLPIRYQHAIFSVLAEIAETLKASRTEGKPALPVAPEPTPTVVGAPAK